MFGKLVGGEDVLDALEALPVKPGTERPAKPVRITEVVMYALSSPTTLCHLLNMFHHRYQDPFDEYKSRQQKKLARKAEAEENARTRKADALEKKDQNETNWFGVKVGSENASLGSGGEDGVGRYLQVGAKRRAPVDAAPINTGVSFDPPEAKKKRKVGFGNFEGW